MSGAALRRKTRGSFLQLLRKAGTEVRYLLNRGYHLKSVTQFVGDHYLFSERQRLALARSTAPDDKVSARKNREIDMEGLEENEDRAADY